MPLVPFGHAAVEGNNEEEDMDPGDRIATIMKTKMGYMRERTEADESRTEPDFVVDPQDVNAVIEDWPAAPKKIAVDLVKRYGPPHEATPLRLLWHGNGEWKRTVVQRDEIPHKFPTAHTDFLSQYIDYQVPIGKFSDLARFDGSVIMDRTAGEVAARCDDEAMNILTLNLANDIVTGAKTVDEARDVYAENASAYMMNRPAPYTEKLQFEVPTGGTADLDESVIAGAMTHQAGEKVSDLVSGERREAPS